MTKLKIGSEDSLFWLGALATAFLVFFLICMWVVRDRIFTIVNQIALLDLTMFIGMIFGLLFNIASLFWLIRKRSKSTYSRATDFVLFGIGILCIVMIMVGKVRVDNIAYETPAAWSIQREYLILYSMLFFQLTYNMLIGMRLLNYGQPESTKKTQTPRF
ncbi:hypothetical protein [Desulfosarcina variabilis]|uniref:hypothetical protein n=1 Tax=Desulfosarcina variabilis TaxID=2300 RepID=UPI003AFB5E51